jgi:hypothetical protein
MSDIGETDYANHPDKKATPELPFNSKSGDVSSGHFSSVVEVKGDQVVKIVNFTRLEDGNLEIPDLLQPFLVLKTDDPEKDRAEVTIKLMDLAKERKAGYELVARYLKDQVPELKGQFIAESPRRSMAATNDDKLPIAEFTLMELWEKVDTRSGPSRMPFHTLIEQQNDPSYKKESELFANRALTLLKEEGIVLDICDISGIRGIDKDNRYIRFKNIDKVLELRSDNNTEQTFYPRNLTFENGKIKFFDFYPVSHIDDLGVSPTYMRVLVNGLKNHDNEAVRARIGDSITRLFVLQYLVLLEKMGGDLDVLLRD